VGEAIAVVPGHGGAGEATAVVCGHEGEAANIQSE
jgi:hypothetical protein